SFRHLWHELNLQDTLLTGTGVQELSFSGLENQASDYAFSCASGEYLEMKNQVCSKCGEGTYSLGSGIKFDEWDELPAGFSNVATFMDTVVGPSDSRPDGCNNSSWVPRGNYIESNRDDCTVSLIYAVHLKKSGYVFFEYQYVDNNIFFEFFIQNDQCQEMDTTADKWVKLTDSGAWGSHSVMLKSGTNILYWRTTGILMGSKAVKPVLVKNITIEGVAYTSECFPCKPGTFSDEPGSFICQVCPRNTYSEKGAKECIKCDEDSQFSEEGSSECKERPPCTTKDYFQIHTPCDEEGKRFIGGLTEVSEKTLALLASRAHLRPTILSSSETPAGIAIIWQMNRRFINDMVKIYSITATNAVDGVASSCRACALGSEQLGSSCVPCPPGHYIEKETNQCKECPPDTYLSVRQVYGKEACILCGPGSRSTQDHSVCYSDCFFYHEKENQSLHYDFSNLSSVGSLMNGPSFTSKGTKYFHFFNISLCGHEGKKLALCTNNITDFTVKEVVAGSDDYTNLVGAFVCQSTIIPSESKGFRAALSSQSIILADTFLGVTVETTLQNINIKEDMFPVSPSQIPDVHFFYKSSTTTTSCVKGRSTAVKMRCNPAKPGAGTISVPRLEYKYSKLVMTTNSKECELPAADSCAIMEGEDNEEEVVYSNKQSLLGKLKSLATKRLKRNDVSRGYV
ncbi:hypothetical protein E2I00_012584, partial [Balaenoptera physalus]